MICTAAVHMSNMGTRPASSAALARTSSPAQTQVETASKQLTQTDLDTYLDSFTHGGYPRHVRCTAIIHTLWRDWAQARTNANTYARACGHHTRGGLCMLSMLEFVHMNAHANVKWVAMAAAEDAPMAHLKRLRAVKAEPVGFGPGFEGGSSQWHPPIAPSPQGSILQQPLLPWHWRHLLLPRTLPSRLAAQHSEQPTTIALTQELRCTLHRARCVLMHTYTHTHIRMCTDTRHQASANSCVQSYHTGAWSPTQATRP